MYSTPQMDDSGSPNSAPIVEMENTLRNEKDEEEQNKLGEDVCQNHDIISSCSPNHDEKSDIIACEENSSKDNHGHESPQTPREGKIWKCSKIVRFDNMSERSKGLHELLFEAKSSKDSAWYDVASFLNHRVSHRGVLEVRVRFAGFDRDEDEWVNVKDGVRESSIPLDASECQKVKVGDLVLCFQERESHAYYTDAYILGIQRKEHGSSYCLCTFIVRFDFDNSEEEVRLKSICRRPETTEIPNENEHKADNLKLSFLY